ncbi:Beta-galactosidase 4 [Senna tora]|uniref:Beta-galactosidase 4 n=1 Tax=Senna tora TaxID=362788 RepID=A0A834T1R4_9FABA|nr:Beta-galactosidase 4 [Senna tora]
MATDGGEAGDGVAALEFEAERKSGREKVDSCVRLQYLGYVVSLQGFHLQYALFPFNFLTVSHYSGLLSGIVNGARDEDSSSAIDDNGLSICAGYHHGGWVGV